jgi:hypothetical protein
MVLRKIEQRPLRSLDQVDDLVDRCAQIEPSVGRNLVVARARGVQPLAGVADERSESLFDVGMNVFEVERPFESAGADFVEYLREAFLDRGEIVRAQIEAACSMRACATEPRMSTSARRRSKSTDAVYRLTS